MRSIFALITAVILLLSIPPLPEAQAGNVGDSLIVGIQSTKTDSILPLNPVERDMMSVYRLVYESLVYIDDDYVPQPQLAQSWEPEGDGKTWKFNLRKNVTFSDGTPLTARDVVATVNYILEMAKDEESPVKGYYSNLKYFVSRITAPDDYTVIVRAGAGRSYYGLLYAMTFPVLSESDLRSENPIGSGPYIITRTPRTAALSWRPTQTGGRAFPRYAISVSSATPPRRRSSKPTSMAGSTPSSPAPSRPRSTSRVPSPSRWTTGRTSWKC